MKTTSAPQCLEHLRQFWRPLAIIFTRTPGQDASRRIVLTQIQGLQGTGLGLRASGSVRERSSHEGARLQRCPTCLFRPLYFLRSAMPWREYQNWPLANLSLEIFRGPSGLLIRRYQSRWYANFFHAQRSSRFTNRSRQAYSSQSLHKTLNYRRLYRTRLD